MTVNVRVFFLLVVSLRRGGEGNERTWGGWRDVKGSDGNKS